MNEIIFLIQEAPEGRYTSRALGESIFTEADTIEELQNPILIWIENKLPTFRKFPFSKNNLRLESIPHLSAYGGEWTKMQF